jgi:hypothetical protein
LSFFEKMAGLLPKNALATPGGNRTGAICAGKSGTDGAYFRAFMSGGQRLLLAMQRLHKRF